MAKHPRTIHEEKNFKVCRTSEDDEFFANGIFHFNISKILDDIHSGELVVEKEMIDISEWFRRHGHSAGLNESHLPTVDIDKSIIQAEIRPGYFSIIDGNHRIERAYRLGVSSIKSYKLVGEQLIPYFISKNGCRAFVDYWNSKL